MRFAVFVTLSALSVFLLLTYVMIKHPHLGPNLWEQAPGEEEPAQGPSAIASGANGIEWRALQRAPGDWSWSESEGRSRAEFGEATGAQAQAQAQGWQFAIVCASEFARISLIRRAPSTDGAIFDVWTTHENRRYQARHEDRAAVITFEAADDILDAIALSRGHFGIAVEGTEPLLIPSWSEVTRVIEDCRD